MTHSLRLGVNIDHVATLRNARGGVHPCPVAAAVAAQQAGASGITLHLREDRRHIRDADVQAVKDAISIPMNFEMAATPEMQEFALALKPHAVCIVPERRQERTTEGGLDVIKQFARIKPFMQPLLAAGIRVSLFIAPDVAQIQAAKAAGAPVIELHTGHYAETSGAAREQALHDLRRGAMWAKNIGLEVHAGHGLTYENVADIAKISEIIELNIGHFLIGEAVFSGLAPAIVRMRALMDEARA